MINSLFVKNYRNLKDLKIPSLGRINLITGKNNTGKSSLLEAVAIYVSDDFYSLSVITSLLEERGEYFQEIKNSTDANIKALSSLFNERKKSYKQEDAIVIGVLNTNEQSLTKGKEIRISFVKFVDEIINDNGVISRRRIILDAKEENNFEKIMIGFRIDNGNSQKMFPLENGMLLRRGRTGKDEIFNENFQFIRTSNIDREINGKLFDKITLTDKENNVIDALKIIEPNSQRIAFIENDSRGRSAVIKLQGSNETLPLRSMGDGINRILTIILALVNAENGYLLLDEFENGLHHSTQAQLWEIIFSLAEKLNVQVFATTHSEDCIVGFEKILNANEKNALMGKFIRLNNKNGQITQVEYDANELKIATKNNIETR